MKLISMFVLAMLLSCSEKPQKENKEQKDAPARKKFEMYEMSEMSMLMEQMYVDNQRLKDRISKGEEIGEFPQHFMKIHQAVMTDPKENDEFFKEQANIFINAQRMIYADPKNAKQHFNTGVSACLSCHEVKCGGPIPRIKKLYIK